MLKQQYEFVRKNFLKLSGDPKILKQNGFYDLSTLTEVEKAHLFEALGSSLEFKTNESRQFESANNLIKLDQLSVTNSFLTCYQEKKKFLSATLPLLIRNSIISNTIQNSSNDKLKQRLMSDFKNVRIALAFDEPNDYFMSPTYPFWQSTARFDQETNTWLLKGKKSRILSDDYDYYLVFCKIKNEHDHGIGSFLIPAEDIIIEPDGTDNYGTKFQTIIFNELNVKKDNAEIAIDDQATLLLNMKASGHLMSSAVLLGIMRQVFNNIIDNCCQVKEEKIEFKNLFINHITRMSEMIYALESALYLTCSHYDTFKLNQMDLYLQAMVVKIMAAEYLEEMLKSIRFLYRPQQISSIVSQDMNDVINVLNAFLDTPTSIRMLLATYGLRNIGRWRYDNVVKLRLNRIYPIHYFKYQYDRFKRQFFLRYPEAYDGFKSLENLDPLLRNSANLLRKVLEIETEMGTYILKLYGKVKMLVLWLMFYFHSILL